MGSERKSKEEEEKKNRSEEGKSKRRRTVEEKEAKSNKKDKSKTNKHKSHKSSKHRSDKEMKSEEKHRSKRHKHDRHSKLDFQELSNDDYFSKNNEFSTWLKEEKNMFFSDLSSESARDLFSQFVKDWNNQKLESRYYEGITIGPRTSHKWKIR